MRAVMITGDHKLTAVAIAKELGLWDDQAVALTGSELEKLPDEELAACIDSARVFARVTAEQKLRIVGAFKRCGHIVAMTGDGVNDAPALREAHIGIAMGQSGTDVAREAADMVIADDNFATIVDAVREGRAIWRNIQKFIFFLLSSNAGLMVAVFTVAFFTDRAPLTPLMILWINLVTNGLPALALGIDPPDMAQMREPPSRGTARGCSSKREWLSMAFVGAWMGAAAVACYLVPLRPGWATRCRDQARAGHRLLAAGAEPAVSRLQLPFEHAVALLTQVPFLPKALIAAPSPSAPAIHLVAVLVPGLRPVFQTFLDGRQPGVGSLLALSASIIPAVEIVKLVQRACSAERAARATRRGPRASAPERIVLVHAHRGGSSRVLAVGAAACGGGARAPETGATQVPSADPSDPDFAAYAATHGIATLNGGGGETPEVTADGLRLELLDKDKPVKLDGVLTEWPAPAKADVVIQGSAAKTGLKISLQYDDARLYVGADVTDASFVAGQDHVSLLLAVPQPGGGFATYDVALYAGKPGESEGSVRYAAAQRDPRCEDRRGAHRDGLHVRGHRPLVGAARGADDARRHSRRGAVRRGRRDRRDRARRPEAPGGDGLGAERAGALDDRAASGPEEPHQDSALGRRRGRPDGRRHPRARGGVRPLPDHLRHVVHERDRLLLPRSRRRPGQARGARRHGPRKAADVLVRRRIPVGETRRANTSR